jgi:hypothetical protein
MPTFSLTVSESSGPISDEFAAIPDNLKDRMRKGFSNLPKLSPENSQALVELVLKTLPNRKFQADDDLLSKLGLDPDATASLFTAVAMASLILSNRKEDSEQFTNAAIQARVMNEPDKEHAKAFLEAVIKNRPAFKLALDREQVGQQVLPSISNFETSVEVRLRFNEDQIALAVPVVVIHIDTDSEGQRVWFQLTKSELKQVIEQLQKALRRIEHAERWTASNSST